MDDPFDSAWLKWDWAARHAEKLKGQMRRFGADEENPPYVSVKAVYRPERSDFALICEALTPPPISWGLLIGDIAHNYRSALNHAAWSIVDRGSKPVSTLSNDQRRAVQFPIESDEASFANRVQFALPGAATADIACVRQVQPFAEEGDIEYHALRMLNALNNDDKHRVIQPAFFWPKSVRVEMINQQDCWLDDDRETAEGVPLVIGAEIGTLKVRPTGPNPRTEIRYDLVADARLPNQVNVGEWLARSAYSVAKVLTSLQPPPFEVDERANSLDPFTIE
jgi:hypothetical protein